MKKQPKLYAVFDKDGNIVRPTLCWSGLASSPRWAAWHSAGFHDDATVRRAKRQGYTCEEVEIVKVKR